MNLLVQVFTVAVVVVVAGSIYLCYLYLYVRRFLDEYGPAPNAEARGGRSSPSVTAAADESVRSCPICGTHNDAEYRFCRACIEELPP